MKFDDWDDWDPETSEFLNKCWRWMAVILGVLIGLSVWVASQPTAMDGATIKLESLTPDIAEVNHFGCTADMLEMPPGSKENEYVLYVYATTDGAQGWWYKNLPDDDWHWHKVAARYRLKNDKNARKKALRDCDAWMKMIEGEKHKGKLGKPTIETPKGKAA